MAACSAGSGDPNAGDGIGPDSGSPTEGPDTSTPLDAGIDVSSPLPMTDAGVKETSRGDSGGIAEGDASGTTRDAQGPNGPAACGLAAAALCETFDAPAGIGNRSGQLNGVLWGVSRASGSEYNPWATTQLTACGSTMTVSAPNDIVICNGQLNEALDDNGGVAVLPMYPKQPFDFAGRTGTVVFDVSNDSQGAHGAWPEFWITDTPNPAPFTHEASWTSYPMNGFGIRFAGCTDSSGVGATCSQGQGAVGVDSAIVVSNYVGNDSFSGGALKVIGLDSVLESAAGQLNHYEVHVAQDQIDVYGTDAFAGALDLSKTPLRHLATIPNANLTLTRGLIWIEDVHYNGNKFGTQRVHTFTWDNVGFDGPILPRDLAFDALDNDVPFPPNPEITDPANELGYFAGANNSVSITVPGVTGTAQATKALLTLNIHDVFGPEPFSLDYSINGHAYSYAWPFPWNNINSDKTLTIPVSLADVQTGDNALTFSTASAVGLTVFNVDLIMVGAGGIVSP